MQDQFLIKAQQVHPDLPLSFDGLLVVVGGGEVDSAVLAELVALGDSVIGADGGADVCLSLGVMPEAVIGDMDSLDDPAAWADRTRLIALDEQQTTDFEKCLYATTARVTVALGMTGKRLDHTLAALDCAARYAKTRHIIFVDSHDLALVCSGPRSFGVPVGERVSIHPLRQVTFARSTGLSYPLDGLTFAPGVASGTSNEATSEQVVIEPEQGDDAPWLLMLDRKYLDSLLNSSMLAG